MVVVAVDVVAQVVVFLVVVAVILVDNHND